jgi:hypothetical protein
MWHGSVELLMVGFVGFSCSKQQLAEDCCELSVRPWATQSLSAGRSV